MSKPIVKVAGSSQDNDSHADHLSEAQFQCVLHVLNAGGGKVVVTSGDFSIVTLTLPEGETALCALRGPVVGDAPITDDRVKFATRAGRPNKSRLVGDLPGIPRNDVVAVIFGNKADPTGATRVLATAYAGPLAPQEPTDPYLAPEAKAASVEFWATHALSASSSGLEADLHLAKCWMSSL